ncbi:hypothetical protein PAMC26577_00715 [Caballeronia sordidicola]|uniref:Uncharacterized protein n=1 Tax=Caballeronia sordidicola TaxID=196367 RepID=A0A242N8D3_CABSO|nr:hypothetical protein PAMC26577_00715 [Caballeronia sordidicola]
MLAQVVGTPVHDGRKQANAARRVKIQGSRDERFRFTACLSFHYKD